MSVTVYVFTEEYLTGRNRQFTYCVYGIYMISVFSVFENFIFNRFTLFDINIIFLLKYIVC